MESKMMLIEEVALEIGRTTTTVNNYANDGDLTRHKEKRDGTTRTVFDPAEVAALKIKKGLGK